MLRCFWEGKKDNVAERPVFRPHFPIQHPLFLDEAERVKYKLIRVIPWELIEQHEAQALKNHKRTIEQLAQQQCGLRASEAVAVLEDRPWRRMPVEEAYDRGGDRGCLYRQRSFICDRPRSPQSSPS